MKIKQVFLLFIIISIIANCTSSNVIVNRKIMTKENEPMLIGQVTRSAFSGNDFNWYSEEYNSYSPNTEILKKIKNRIKLYRIEIYMGTWCSDTHEQFPRFMKILDNVSFPERKIAIYGLNRKMESFYGEQVHKSIHNVPTFIIYRGNHEVGRIVEHPKESLEQDLYNIISKTVNY